MKLTCVTATFNAIAAGRREQLIRCVNSVAQLKTEHEHLIYDGASTDGTVELLRELEKSTPGLKVVSEKDAGIYNALNKGVRDARGEWFYVLGCDDYIVHPNIMEQTILDNGTDVDMSVSAVERDNGTVMFSGPESMRYFFFCNCHSHQGILLKTKWVRFFGGFDEGNPISADYDLLMKVHKSGLNVRYTYVPFTMYSVGGLSCDGARNELYDIPLLCRHLNLTHEQAANRRTASLPLRKLLPYVFHKDLIMKGSARFMFRNRVRYVVKSVLISIPFAKRAMKVLFNRHL